MIVPRSTCHRPAHDRLAIRHLARHASSGDTRGIRDAATCYRRLGARTLGGCPRWPTDNALFDEDRCEFLERVCARCRLAVGPNPCEALIRCGDWLRRPLPYRSGLRDGRIGLAVVRVDLASPRRCSSSTLNKYESRRERSRRLSALILACSSSIRWYISASPACELT